MKKVIAWLLVLALTAAISIGATLAYLTDTDEDVNVMTLGKVKIDQLEYERIDTETTDADATVQEFHDNKPLIPAVTENGFDYTPGTSYVDWEQIGKDGYTSEIWNPEKINNEVDKMVFIKNKGDYDAYVRSVFAFEAGNYATLNEFKQMVHLNLNTTDYTWEWVETPVAIPGEDGTTTTNYFIATATYNKVLTPGALTEISLSQIALDKTATNEDVEAFGDTYQVLVKSQGIQADGFTDPDTALNEGFGVIAADNIPWDNDAPTKGIDVRTALHYLEGDTTTSAITANVSNVIFGLNKDHTDITDANTGVLVDVGQDVSVYAYYVKNGSNYDVYFLADDEIYAPANSSGLFKDMTALKTVDTANLDVSRTENMVEMFRNCTALTEVDVSEWDTGNVTSMNNMFRNCKVLPEIDVADWDTSKVTGMAAMFRECKAITELDTAKWDVSNVNNFTQAFAICDNLQIVHTSDWDTSGATTFSWMFYECRKLHTLDVSDWDTSNVTDMEYMFDNCKSLVVLELGGWNTSNVTTMDHMFASRNQNAFDMKFAELDVSEWDTSKVTEMNSMFYGCGSLTKLDLSGWDVSKVTTVNHMFADCNHLSELNLKGWDTSSLVVMDCFLNDCDALTVVDVSTFKTHNVKDFSQVFDNCALLTQIIGLENWDTSNGLVFEEMFAGCPSLKELDLSSFNTRNALDKYKSEADTYNGYQNMFTGTSGLEKLVLGADFSFDGDGKVTTESYKVGLPAPAAKAGYTGKWKNVDTGEVYLASEIPEETAATYVPYYEYTPKGATLKDALHYLNANPSGTKITAKVTNVIFGRNEDYADIVNNYTGVLADQEQDGPVYAYYVPNGSYYDIYVLSDDVIYTPENSTELFFKMENLVTVDTSNLDVSRTKDMTDMFYRCYKLEEVDVSEWDTSNVTSMVGVFARCYVLTNVDVSGWDTGNSKLFNSMFSDCYKLNLDKDALANWDMSSAVRINHMFYACSVQEELDLSGWDMPNMVTTTHMFADCNSLKSVDLTGWNTPSMVSMDAMFNDCHSLTYLDVSSLDTANCNEFTQVFESCRSLETIVGLDKWDTGNARTYEELFSGCAVLKEVDLSTFKSRDVVNDFVMEWKGTGWGFLRMFSGMNSLEKMTLSADFSFDGDGKVTTDSYKVSLPSPAAKEGFTAKWQNVETGELYDASEIPEETAATYVAYYEPIVTP